MTDDPQWLEAAIRVGWNAFGTYDDADDAIRAALPLIKAGVEQDLRERIEADIVEAYKKHLDEIGPAIWLVRHGGKL